MSDKDQDPETPGPSAEDISEAERLVADLRRSNAFLNLVIENIPAMVAVKDAEHLRFILGNRAGDDLVGLSRREALGKSDFDFFPREQAEAFVAFDREVLASGELRVIPEEPITTRYKGTRYLRTLKMPVLDEDGKLKYLLAMSEDITERKQAEAALRASEAMFRSLLNASPDAVAAVDGDGLIVLANERFRSMYGYGPEELIGKPMRLLMPADAAEESTLRIRNALAASTLGASAIVPDLSGLRRDGTIFPAEATLSEHEGDDGRVVIISIRDVTDRRAVETQLRQSQKMEAIGTLTGGLAHDFNNLLSVIIGNLDLVGERLREDAASNELVGEALAAALRGADLTRRLLAFARKQPLQPRPIDVNELVRELNTILVRTLGGNIEVDLRLGEDIWPVVADPAQLESSLINLATNARDAMPDGGTLRITTDNRELDADYAGTHEGLTPGPYALIEISDTGTGIAPEALGQIFEPFFTTKEGGKGTGLGLSMVFGFMKQSGGHINVYSEVGVGTTFRLYLPRQTDKVGALAPAPPASQPALAGGEIILVVEDNPGLRDLVVRQLTQLGYRCLEAGDGPSALGMLESETVDLVFTDVVMPNGMSGYDLGRDVRARWPTVGILLTSGFTEERRNGSTAPAGGMRLLSKPYRKADLAHAIRDALDGRP